MSSPYPFKQDYKNTVNMSSLQKTSGYLARDDEQIRKSEIKTARETKMGQIRKEKLYTERT